MVTHWQSQFYPSLEAQYSLSVQYRVSALTVCSVGEYCFKFFERDLKIEYTILVSKDLERYLMLRYHSRFLERIGRFTFDPHPFGRGQTNKQTKEPPGGTYGRTGQNTQTDERQHTSKGARVHRRKDKSKERPNLKVHLGRASHLSHP